MNPANEELPPNAPNAGMDIDDIYDFYSERNGFARYPLPPGYIPNIENIGPYRQPRVAAELLVGSSLLAIRQVTRTFNSISSIIGGIARGQPHTEDIVDAPDRPPMYEDPDAFRIGANWSATIKKDGKAREINPGYFNSDKAEDWLSWVQTIFTRAAEANNWTAAHAKRVLSTSIRGKFMDNVADIDPNQLDAQGEPITLLRYIGLLSKAILPPSASQFARSTASNIKQEDHEDMTAYLARLKAAHRRAYPDFDWVNNDAAKEMIMTAAIRGMANPKVQERCYSNQSSFKSLDDVAEYALDQCAALVSTCTNQNKPMERGIFAMNRGAPNARKRSGNDVNSPANKRARNDAKPCNFCKGKSHTEATCFKKPGQEHFKEAFEQARKNKAELKKKSTSTPAAQAGNL